MTMGYRGTSRQQSRRVLTPVFRAGDGPALL